VGIDAIFTGIKRPGDGGSKLASHIFVEVKNEWSCISVSLYASIKFTEKLYIYHVRATRRAIE
jgi:hypothetical protein